MLLLRKRILMNIRQKAQILAQCSNKAEELSAAIIAGARAQRKDKETAIRRKLEAGRQRSLDRKRARLARVYSECQRAMKEAMLRYENSVKVTHDEVAALEGALGWSALNFNHTIWNNYVALRENATKIPSLTRIGELCANGEGNTIRVPAFVRLLDGKHIFLKASGEGLQVANRAMQCLLLRLLAGLPAGKLRLTLIDPAAVGLNLAGFGELPQAVRGARLWTKSDDIEEQLDNLSDQMIHITQNHLKHHHLSLEDSRLHAGEMTEPYRILAIANFPQGFTDSSCHNLVQIARNGARTGIFIIATIDQDGSLPYEFQLSELERDNVVIDSVENCFQWQGDAGRNWTLELDDLPAIELFDHIMHSVGKAAEIAMEVKIPFETIVQDPSLWWQCDSRAGLSTPIGITSAGKLLYFELGIGTVYHGLIGGNSGLGKSVLIHVVIVSTSITYSPEEINFYIIDFKGGVELQDYAKYALPHLKIIALNSDREYALSILRHLEEELERRANLFSDGNVAKIKQYRDKFPDRKLPRILLLVDEYQKFFKEDDALADQAARIIETLAREGRSFGIHMVMASQTGEKTGNLTQDAAEQMSLRIAFFCREGESRLILGEDNPAAATLSRKGEAIYNSASGAVNANRLVQIFMLEEDARRDLLQGLRTKLEQSQRPIPAPAIVFDGKAPVEFESNGELAKMIHCKDYSKKRRVAKAWLGEQIAIAPHVFARFQRQSRANLLLVGQGEVEASTMMLTAILSLASQQAPSQASFTVVNLSHEDAEWHHLPKILADSVPHAVRLPGLRDLGQTIADVAHEVDRRSENAGTVSGSSLYLIIMGMHRARKLRMDDDTKSPAAESLAAILSDGPEVGVHTLVWLDTLMNFGRIFERRTLGEFDMRVALQMGEDASFALINRTLASKLGKQRAYYYEEEMDLLQKFRPYSQLSEQQIVKLGRKLSRKAARNDS